MHDQALDRSGDEPVRKPLVGGMPVWDRFNGSGPWILEHPTAMPTTAKVCHENGEVDHVRVVIERAWAIQKPGGLEVVAESRLTSVPPRRGEGWRVAAILVAAMTLMAPYASLVLFGH